MNKTIFRGLDADQMNRFNMWRYYLSTVTPTKAHLSQIIEITNKYNQLKEDAKTRLRSAQGA